MQLDELVLSTPAWMADALCVEYADRAGWWFPERGESARPAKEVCARCLVRGECLEYALAEGLKQGIWGGLSPQERSVRHAVR